MRLIKWSFLAFLLAANISLFAGNDLAFARKKDVKPVIEQKQAVKPELAPKECPVDQGMFLTLDFLFWGAQNNGFYWGMQNNTTDGIAAEDITNLTLDPDWNPGVKLGIGWDTLHDYWDILAKWNFYYSHATEKVSRPNATATGGGIFVLAGLNWPAYFCRNANAQWRLKYNMFDLEIGKVFHISKMLSLRTHAGTRGGWIDQVFRASYTDNLTSNYVADNVFRSSQDYWGIGPRLGIDGNWNLGSGFSLFGNIAASFIYGKFKVHEKQRFLSIAIGGTTPGTWYDLVGLKNNFYELSPNVEAIIGFAWGKCFNNEKTFFGIKAGWETTYWWNQYHIRRYIAQLPPLAKENHPVTIQGLTVNAKVDF